MQQYTVSEKTDAYNVLMYAKHLYTTASQSQIKHGLKIKLSLQVRNPLNSRNF